MRKKSLFRIIITIILIICLNNWTYMSVLNYVFADSNIEENQIPDMTDANAVMDHITDGIGDTEDLMVTDNSGIIEQSISEESNIEEPIPETPISAEPIPNEVISEDEVIPETPIKPIPEESIPEEIIPEEIIPEEIIPEEPIIEEPIIIDETEPVNYDDLVDAEKYIMENYTSMTEEDVIGIIWPEMELDELEWDLKNQELKLHTNFIDDCNKEVNAYGYVWSYDNEQPTVIENQGFVEIGQGNQLSSFDYSLTYGKGDIYVRAYVVYDENYVGYSNQRQYFLEDTSYLYDNLRSSRLAAPMMSVSANPTMMSMSTIPLLSEGEPVGATYFKDTGDDLDKLRIAAIYNYGYLKIELDVDSLPSDSSYLVLRGAFGGFAHLAFNGNNMGYVGSGLNNLYYAFKLPNDYVKQGNNTIEFFVYGMAWAKVDSVSIVVDGGNKTNGQIKNIGFEDWSMTYNSKIDTYFADIYANSTTQDINTTAGLQLVNSIGLYGQNHFSSSDYATLNLAEDKYRFRVTLPDNVEKDGSAPNETGNWNLFSIIIQNKRALTVESKGFYYTDSKGLRNFGLNFTQDCSRYTNGSITIKATVDDLFKRPFSHLILPDGSKVYDYEADYTVSENGAYTFKVAEPDGTVTSFVHNVTNIDKTAPQIAILSDPTIIILETNIYVDPGVSVSDNLSGFDSMEPEIDYNGLNIADTQPGTYTIKYTIFDRAGNSNSTSRIVIVKNKPLKVMTGDIFKDPSNVSINGNLAYFGEEEITEKGLVWGVISNPTIDNNEGKQSWTTDILNKNNFSKTIAINSLIENAAYNVRAYAKTATGRIVYGQNKTFEANNKSYGSFQLTNTNIRIEKGNSIQFDIARTGGSDGEVQVYYRTINGSAVEGIHFNNNFGFVTFTDGDSTTKSVTVSTLNYSTWEKANRQFYFEIYQLEGKGNIGSSNFASVTFTNDTDDISNIKNGSWDSIWSTYNDYTSDSNKTMYTSEVSLAQYAYWREQASSFLGRGYGTIETYLVDVRFQLLKLTTSWVDAGYSYFASIDGFKYTRDNGVNVKDASKLKLKIDVEHAGGLTDHGGVKDPGVQIYIKDISVPRIEYFYSINGDYAEGDTVYVSTAFNEIVTSSNITDVRMNIKLYDIDGNEVIQKANYITGINTDTLVFGFVVPAGKYNSKLEFAETNFDNYGNINDLAGNAFTGIVPSTVINASAHIASTCHNIFFLPNGNGTPALNHSTSVTVTKSLSDPAKITTTEYLWAADRNTKINGFKSFSNGETLDIGGATGSFYLHIRSRDDYGNETYVISNPFILNNAEPTFSLIPDTLDWTKNDVKITVSDIPTDAIISSYQYRTGFYTVENFGNGTDFTGSGSFLVSTNDFYSVCLTTNMGKKYVNTIKVSNIDKIAPVVEIDTETNGSDGKTVYLASTEATGVDEGGSQLSTLQYVWTNSSTKPKEGWMDFSSGERLEKIASGIWYLHIQAVDNAGNESYTCSNPFILDNIGPEINVTGSDFIDWTNQEIILTVSASKNNLDYVMMPDLTTVPATDGIVNTTFTADKNGYYKFIAVDEAGNTAEAGINITKIDADAPKILVSKSTEDWTAGNIALTISSEDNASPIYNNNGDVIEYGGIGGIMIRKQGSALFEEYTGPFVFDVTENGLYQITAKDALGNQTTRDIRITNIDKTPPFVDADNTDYGAKDSSIAVTLIYSDAEMGVVRRKEYKVTSSTETPTIYDFYDGRPIVLNREGTYYIHYRAVDEVNNTVTGYFGPYIINSAVPSITLQSSDAMTYKKSHSVQVIVDFNGFSEGEINYQWTENSQIPSTNWESAIENNGTISQAIVNGDYYLHVRVIANGSYYYASKLFKFDNTAPVVILNGDNPTSLPYGAAYVEKGVKYSDNYDLWPRYTAPDLSIIKSNVLGTYTLNYLVTDSAGNETNLRRTVNVIDVTPPVATTVELNVNEDNILSLTKEDFILSYSDDATSLSKIKILSLPANGQLKLGSGTITQNQIIDCEDISSMEFIPEAEWNGSSYFRYCAYDGYDNESNESLVNIMVHSINDVPTANNDSASTDEDCSVRVNVRNNDYDVETDTVSLVVQSITQAAHGTVTNNGDGTVTYLPNVNWNGTDNFTYTVCDSDNGTATAIVTIKVNPINDTPTAPLNLIMDSLAPYKGGESVIVSWNGAFDADEENLSYELDYYDGTDWNNIGKNITETSKAFIIPTIDIKKAKMRIRSYDGKVWSIDYKESNEFEIDSTKPQVSLSVDSSDWTSADITVNFITEDKEGSGIADTKYCYAKALNDTTWSTWNAYTSGDYISFIEDGIYKLKVKTIDNAGNVSNEIESGVYKVDKTAPISFITHTVIDSTTQITVNGTTTDSNAHSSVVSDLAAEPYDYSIDGAYNGVYEADGSYHFVSLQPNKQYTFKMKAIDQAGNIIQTSEVSKYTKAEDPTGSIAKSCTKDTLNVTLIANSYNAVAPQCQVWITRKDDNFDNIVSSSPYSRELERTFTALPENTKYDLWVKVKNEDGVENLPIKVGTYKTNKVPEIVINSLSNIYKKAGEMIEITGVVSDADNEDVIVSANLNGKEKSINISNTSDGADWSLRWDIDTDSIAENNYKGLVMTAADIQNNQDSMSYTGDIIVDKTSPLAPNITAYGGWSSQNCEGVKIADNDDLGSSKSGVNRIEYMLEGAEETDGFVAYKEEFFIAQEGITQITARVIDNAGNISTETTKTVYIDRTNPEVVPTSVDGPIFTNGKENKTVDWTNTDYSVDMTYADTVGIDKIYYEVTQSIEPPVLYDDFVNENVSYEKDVKTVVKSISINREGENFIHYKIIDLAGNIVTGYSGPYKLDKTVPKIFEINVDSVQAHSITISGETIDSTSNSAIVSGTEAIFYDFSLNSEYNNEYKEQSTYQFTNLLSSNEYVLKMRARDKAGNVIETDEVTVKTKKSKKYQDSNLVEISLDGDKLNHIKEMASIDLSNENSVQISIINGSVQELLENDRIEDVISLSTETNSQIIIDGLTGLDIKQMENKNVALEIKNAAASYLLPAKQINIDSIMDKLDNQVSLEEILVQIEISNPSEKEVKRIESTIEQKEYETVGNPVNFEIKCSFRNKTVESSKFNKYVERAIAIPAEIHSDRITTGVRIDEDGSIHHVPTKVVNVNGRYYAKINSLTNSLYTLIWHSVEYSDVKKHWAKDAINDLGSRMVISGVGSGMFKPDRDITRGEFTATIVRALGLKEGTEKNLFSDVKSGDWYCKSIETAYEYGLISGYGDKKFNPKGKITREEAIVILTRAMSLTDLTINIESGEIESILSSFKDYDETSKWAKSSLASCVKVGIVSGNYNKMLTPKDYITRAEVAVTIRKLLQKSELI